MVLNPIISNTTIKKLNIGRILIVYIFLNYIIKLSDTPNFHTAITTLLALLRLPLDTLTA